MSSYHCYDEQENYRIRFPDDSVGLAEWEQLIGQLNRLEEPLPEDEDPLLELRRLHRTREQNLQLRCPRVFISHRRCDKNEALRVAWLANAKRFDYWLDILDPNIAAASLNPNLSGNRQAVLLAAIIEMALLNCTHVLAVMTKNVLGTMWMPYEYGRVKDSALTSVRAAGWFDQSWHLSNVPEYFHLGQKLFDDPAVSNWLETQFTQWENTQVVPMPPCPSEAWSRQVPAPLSGS
jgi:hypothetical protein